MPAAFTEIQNIGAYFPVAAVSVARVSGVQGLLAYLTRAMLSAGSSDTV